MMASAQPAAASPATSQLSGSGRGSIRQPDRGQHRYPVGEAQALGGQQWREQRGRQYDQRGLPCGQAGELAAGRAPGPQQRVLAPTLLGQEYGHQQQRVAAEHDDQQHRGDQGRSADQVGPFEPFDQPVEAGGGQAGGAEPGGLRQLAGQPADGAAQPAQLGQAGAGQLGFDQPGGAGVGREVAHEVGPVHDQWAVGGRLPGAPVGHVRRQPPVVGARLAGVPDAHHQPGRLTRPVTRSVIGIRSPTATPRIRATGSASAVWTGVAARLRPGTGARVRPAR